jgi:hypothetical protein
VICLAFAKGIIIESKGVKVNWAKFAKVTFKYQARHSNTKVVLPP